MFPPLASILLPWRSGGGAALDLCVSGRSIGAEEALRLGVVSRVVDDPAAAFDEFFAAELAGLSASSLRHVRHRVQAERTCTGRKNAR